MSSSLYFFPTTLITLTIGLAKAKKVIGTLFKNRQDVKGGLTFLVALIVFHDLLANLSYLWILHEGKKLGVAHKIGNVI